MKYSIVSSYTTFLGVEESDEQTFETGVQFLDVILENDIDLLPYITRDRDHSQIDIIKDKLINSKRLFDSPSITNKLNLSNEYENLSESISYRLDRNGKYDLILKIIHTYRISFKEMIKLKS
ncbi:unnamed protein product [Rotaria sp. Silwood1]|nr:unnamed protein product [Rotaria sp. Silwood1]